MTLSSTIQINRQTKYKLNNGQYIPAAGFGVYQLPKEKTIELVYAALLEGYRHIDTAVAYNNQKEVACAISKFLKDHPDKAKRSDIWFTTKILNSQQGYEETRQAIKEISDDVREYIDYVDLILIHSPKTNKEKRLGSWKALQEFVLDPSNEILNVKSIGVSNYGIAHLEELFNWDGFLIKPVVNQLELHPWLPHCNLRNYLVQHDILAEAYSPLTQGEKFNDPELVSLSKKYKMTPAEILLKWSYLQGFIVLAKTENRDRIKQNLSILAPGENDKLDHTSTSNLGKIDLDIEILQALDKPDSKEVLCWGREDPTEYEG